MGYLLREGGQDPGYDLCVVRALDKEEEERGDAALVMMVRVREEGLGEEVRAMD
jgi:hypothetical protein